MKLYFDAFGKLSFFVLSLVALVGCSADMYDAQLYVALTPLQSCLEKVERSDRSCFYRSFSGGSGIAQNPQLAAQCRAQKFEETKWCYEQFE